MATETFARIKQGADARLALGVNAAGVVVLQQASETDNSQVWRVKQIDLQDKTGCFLVHHTTSKALTWTLPGGKVTLANFSLGEPSAHQLWDPVSITEGQTSNKQILSVKDNNVCLDVGSSLTEGADVLSSTWVGGATQQWTMAVLEDKHLYPAPLASHADILTNKNLFQSTLNSFHIQLGSALKVPSLGGKELDLHLLYREVVGRGGLAEVTRQRAWKDIVNAFQLPSTITNASFVLRKSYSNLLHHYEQVYLFATRGPLIPPPSALPAPNPVDPASPQVQQAHLSSAPGGFGGSLGAARNTNMGAASVTGIFANSPEANPALMIGQSVTGAIHAKFDYGYLVTVQVGAEKVKGILYHKPQGGTPHPFSLAMATGTGPKSGKARRKRRKKSEMRLKDPDAPKALRSAYNFYFQEWRKRMKNENPELTDRECTARIGETWSNLAAEGREPYRLMAEEDKSRHAKEVLEYSQRADPDANLPSRASNLETQAAAAESNEESDDLVEDEEPVKAGVGGPAGGLQPEKQLTEKKEYTHFDGQSQPEADSLHPKIESAAPMEVLQEGT